MESGEERSKEEEKKEEEKERGDNKWQEGKCGVLQKQSS